MLADCEEILERKEETQGRQRIMTEIGIQIYDVSEELTTAEYTQKQGKKQATRQKGDDGVCWCLCVPVATKTGLSLAVFRVCV
jgi:hypothetical protein